jgi:hypothetical protein
MSPDLTDEEIAACSPNSTESLTVTGFPLSPRIRILTGIRDKFRPPPVR